MSTTKPAALSGIRVLDSATIFAGPYAATLLADFGADVIKVEHPKGDPLRNHGGRKNGAPLWWKALARNKRAITLNLSNSEGQAVMKKMIAETDVWIENFRPGTLERWGLGYDVLSAINPRLVLVRVTGFGQFGPYSKRPGFGTLAEAMSGFASLTGQPDGPPTLPPFGLGDGVAGIATALATMVALRGVEQTGRGQVVDVALIEPLMSVLAPQSIMVFDQLGIKQPRLGNRSATNAPRNTYMTADKKWVAISTSADAIAARLMTLVGWPEVTKEPWFHSASGRVQHADALDKKVADWISQHTLAEVVTACEEAQAAVAPLYDIEDIFADPQYQALDTITTVPDEDLGSMRMQNVIFRLSETPGQIAFTGRKLGQDTDAVLSQFDFSADEIENLRQAGAI